MMKLLLACVAVTLLAPEVELSIYRRSRIKQEPWVKAGICPDLISVPPSQLSCFYGNIEVTPGIYLSPQDTYGQLTIEYDDYEPGCSYTVIILDITFNSCSSCSGCSGSYMLLSYYANVKDLYNYIDSGVTLASYCPPLFATATETKTILILVIRQPNEIDSSNCIENSYDSQRFQFDLVEYLSNSDNEIVAANFYYTCLENQENYSG